MSTTQIEVVPTGTWSADKVHSTVGFAVKYMVGTFQGSFSDFDAELRDGVLRGSARVASIEVKDPNLAAHLQAPDFFDAERHPELTFESREITRDGERLEIKGEITIKGHTEPVNITGVIGEPIQDPFGGERFGLTLEAKVDRTAFGISWNNPLPSGEKALSNTVTLIADLQLSKQA
ncbi:MAG TPA: YceI family protein [Solirubrobacteraceae bacterium]|nr:YceI family protein [Solirubrobacteraceae bacterium]